MKNKALLLAVVVSVAFSSCKHTDSFTGFYFDTAVTVSASSDSNIEVFRQLAAEVDCQLSAHNVGAAVYDINHGDKYVYGEHMHIDNILEGYAHFENRFGKGVTPFCGSLTQLWNVTADNPVVPSEADILRELQNVYDSSEFSQEIPIGAVLDFGSGGKGYYCDLALKEALDNDMQEIIVSCGSSSVVYSKDGREFITEIIDPVNGDNILISTNNAFISTSGGYERFFEANGKKYSHIMDISSGYPAQTDIASVTVVLPCETNAGLESDLLSTLVYIGGSKQLQNYVQICSVYYPDYGLAVIYDDGAMEYYGSINCLIGGEKTE